MASYVLQKNQRNILLVPKEALIGEHNLKPLLTVHKESIDWWSLASPQTQCNNKDIILILGYNYV